MCQGVIISMVKFDANGKGKRVILRGIGGHAQLLSDNKKKLEKAGWTESAKNQDVISIESDFSGWNKYTIESGTPSKSEVAILTREYKKIAGNAGALISHVRACGKIDDALVKLFTAPARAECEKVTDSAWAEYEKVRDSARAEYEKVRASARAEYEKVTAPAWAEYEKVRDSARAEYEKVRDSARAEYEKVTAPAWAEYEKVTASAWAEYEKVRDSAWAEYEKVRAIKWTRLFAKKENRVKHLQ